MWSAAPKAAIDTVVLSGEASPDGNGQFQSFSAPILNGLGQIAFHASLNATAGGDSDNFGLYRGDAASAPLQVMREGGLAPDGNGRFTLFPVPPTLDPPSLNDSGSIAFRGRLANTLDSPNDTVAIYRWDGAGQLMTLARLGDEIADHPVIQGFTGDGARLGQPDLNDAGQVAFVSQFTPVDNPSVPTRAVIVTDTHGSYDLAATALQPTPDGEDQLGFFIGAAPVLNNSGQIAVSTRTQVQGNEGIFRGDGSGALSQIALVGQTLSGSEETLRNLDLADDLLSINDAGVVAFVGEIAASTTEDRGLFIGGGDGDLITIAREGQPAPDANGYFFSNGSSHLPLALNNREQVAFMWSLRDTVGAQQDDRGVFLGDRSGELVQVAREGQTAPNGDGGIASVSSFHLNNAGQIALLASVESTDAEDEDYDALLLYDPTEGLVELVRSGSEYLGSTITHLDLYDPSYSRLFTPAGNNRSALNEHGQIAFRFDLADGRRGLAIASFLADLAGDYDGNGVIEPADYDVWRASYGDTGSSLNADGNRDGRVDAADYAIWRDAYDATPAASVPEPSSLKATLIAAQLLTSTALVRRRARAALAARPSGAS